MSENNVTAKVSMPTAPVKAEASVEAAPEAPKKAPAANSVDHMHKPASIMDDGLKTDIMGYAGDWIPANWNIQGEGEQICAVNSTTGSTFSGTRKDFSALMRTQRVPG